jgi:putative oxidoreductase
MPVTVSVGLLVLRIIGGMTITAHGAQKLLGWFGGPGVVKLASSFAGQGLKPGWFWANLVILGELGGGLSVAFGLLTPLGAAGMFGAMSMAIAKTHWKNGFWNSKRGLEFPLQLLAIATGIGIAGPGAYALDTLFHIALPEAPLFGILAAVALLTDLLGLALSRPRAAPTAV